MSAVAPLRFALGLVLTVTVLAGIGWGSRAPYDAPGSERALLRFSWRMQSAESQVCRDRTQAELDALPAHMRTPQLCESSPLVYRLETRIDGAAPETRVVRAAGARGDRPLVVWHDVPLAPGRHVIAVRFHREGEAASGALSLDTTITATLGKVVLITVDDGRLVAR